MVLCQRFKICQLEFAINTQMARKWWVRPFLSIVNAFPVDSTSPMETRALIEEVRKDRKCMIFPEGRITVTGSLMKIYEGAGVIAERAKAKILPVRINGAQYSKFSYLKHKLRTRYFPKIQLNILPPKCFDIKEGVVGRERRHVISNQLYDVMVEMMYTTSLIHENIFTSLLHAEKIHGQKHKIAEDISRKPLTYKKLIQKIYVLGNSYKSAFPNEKQIGLLLPNTLANVVSFFALEAIDKIPAMLNFSLGIPQILSCVKTVKIKTIITSSRFISQAHLEHVIQALEGVGIRIIYLENFAQKISIWTKITGLR
ncbi:MAG: acyl-[ACP]--phospholipid O-acyltransferase, partial [Sphingobacteriia bacterium]|nr:acyl-[ACP]--phospholipid O-acyltransferase [Sphingobacteriia bacterium]